MSLTTRLRVLLVAALGALAVPAAPAQAVAPRFGVQIQSVDGGTDPARTDAELDVARSAGATLVRIGVPWSALEPKASGVRDAATLAAADHAVAAAAARGLRVVLVMTSTPCWASAAPASLRGTCSSPDANRFAVTRYPPATTAPYVRLSTFMVRRYQTRLAAFEVWNEPDQSNEAYWAGPNKVARYVRLTKALYRPLKRENPRLTVLAGAFTSYNGRWLRALYRAGIRGSYDALSMHLYAQALYGLRINHAVQVANRDRRPVWLGETGWTSCAPAARSPEGHVCVDPAQQGALLSDLVTSLRTRPRYVRAIIDYKVADDDARFQQFGLVGSDLAPKPALGALQAALRPARLRPVPVHVTLTRDKGGVMASVSGPNSDAYALEAVVNGRLRYRRSFYLGVDGTYRFRMPTALGTTMAVTVTHPWLARTARASIGTG